MAEPGPFLPYRCNKLHSEFLNSPCIKNLARIKALGEKFPGGHVGPLEHCLECRGKDLIVREMPPQTDAAASPGKEIREEEKMAGVVVFKDLDQAEKVLGPGKLTSILAKTEPSPTVGQAPVHPPTLPPTPVVMKELTLEAIARGREAVRRPMDSAKAGKAGPLAPEHPCPDHRENERHRDKNGDLLPFCQTCYSERGRKNFIPGQGCKRGAIVVHFPKQYAAEAEWFFAQAETNVRSPLQQVIYLCKEAMKGFPG